MRSPKTISAHNHFAGAVWAAVHAARTTRNNRFRVVQLPGQKRWAVVVDQLGYDDLMFKTVFKVKSYQSDEDHLTACRKAGAAIRKWQEGIYREFAKTLDTTCIPRRMGDNTREQLLMLAVRKDHADAIALLVQAGADLNFASGRPLRMAVRLNHQASVLALLKAGASITVTRELFFKSQFYGTPRSWQAFLVRLVNAITKASLDESLPLFRELATIGETPECRPVIVELANKYPRLLAWLL